jgi:hypothetical protein
MLIDVSRKPIRVLANECPPVVVVRTMATRGKATGLVHQNTEIRYKEKSKAIQPSATVLNGDVEHIETILPAMDLLVARTSRIRGTCKPEHYTVSGFHDQMTKLSGVWRINFIYDPTSKGDYLLTLLDETNNILLFTVQITQSPLDRDPTNPTARPTTPLQRYLNKRENEGPDGPNGLWEAVLNDYF